MVLRVSLPALITLTVLADPPKGPRVVHNEATREPFAKTRPRLRPERCLTGPRTLLGIPTVTNPGRSRESLDQRLVALNHHRGAPHGARYFPT